MQSKSENLVSERGSTDDSLRAERRHTDLHLARKRSAVEEKADEVVQRANGKADEITQAARALADRKAQHQTGPETRTLEVKRAVEDNALQGERLQAELIVRREREQRQRALAGLLRFERDETDAHLLTERGRSDEALSTRDVFLAMVSHDLRTLLGGIAVYAEVLADELPVEDGEGNLRSCAQRIQLSTARMNRIIGDLVDIASIEAGKLVIRQSPQDLNPLVRESIDTFQRLAAANSIALAVEHPATPVVALIDRDRIFQVLANLLANAIKFTDKGGSICLRVEALEDGARVSITDTGAGIAPEHLEAIFGRFWQVGRSDCRGLGLGLYISRCIAHAHQGLIWAESVVGVGSTFFFTVPGAGRPSP